MPMNDVFARAVERHPMLGMVFTFGGFATWVMSLLHWVGALAGCGAAVFAFVTGYYTMRIKKLECDRKARGIYEPEI